VVVEDERVDHVLDAQVLVQVGTVERGETTRRVREYSTAQLGGVEAGLPAHGCVVLSEQLLGVLHRLFGAIDQLLVGLQRVFAATGGALLVERLQEGVLFGEPGQEVVAEELDLALGRVVAAARGGRRQHRVQDRDVALDTADVEAGDRFQAGCGVELELQLAERQRLERVVERDVGIDAEGQGLTGARLADLGFADLASRWPGDAVVTPGVLGRIAATGRKVCRLGLVLLRLRHG
jgi:hypothetical protein